MAESPCCTLEQQTKSVCLAAAAAAAAAAASRHPRWDSRWNGLQLNVRILTGAERQHQTRARDAVSYGLLSHFVEYHRTIPVVPGYLFLLPPGSLLRLV